MKVIAAIFFLLSMANALASTCQVAAKQSYMRLREPPKEVASMKDCAERGSIIGWGWDDVMIRYIDNEGVETIIKIEKNPVEDFDTFFNT